MANQENEIKCKKFIDELNSRKPYEKLPSADRNFESLMAMRDRRAGKYGISIKESFGEVTNSRFEFKPTSTKYRDDRYFVTREEAFMSHKIAFTKANRILFSHESNRVDVIADVIDVIDPYKLPADAYICPNCGSMATVDKLATIGCPSCGTQFSIPQLFPKVSHFSYTEVVSDTKKRDFLKSILPALITYVVFSLIFLPLADFDRAEGIFGFIFVPLCLAVVAYGISWYIRMLKARFSDLSQRLNKFKTMHETDYAKYVFEKTMAKYGPIFNFQYFSSRVYNLLGALIYAQDKNECPFYAGPDIIGRFDNIIDYVPIGVEIMSFRIDDDGKCTIGAKVIADTYSYVNGRILHRKAEFVLNASKNMDYPIDINFSAHTYKCDGCGGSYDVTKMASCSFCGRPHDLLDEEWYIDGEVKVAFKRYSLFTNA